MPAPRGVFALLVTFTVAFAAIAAALPTGLAVASATWPPSTGLVLAEVMTGGASASDEYVEIANAGPTDADLGGCELVYVTASGTTSTRKASFGTPSLLAPGQHLLVANAAGIYGPLADATYSGGLAADGGTIALRHVDGTVIDAVGWGTAANAFVEGAVAPAPPPKSSIERLPGGAAGNSQDTNDNRADWFVQSDPIPQSLASTPVPRPSASPTATAPTPATTPTTSASPTATAPATVPASPTPPPTAAATSTPEPTATLAPSPTLLPTATLAPSPTLLPTATLAATVAPTPSPTAPPSPTPSPTELVPDLEAIAAARAHPAGDRVHVGGVVTTEPGVFGADGLFAIQDSSGGIFVRVSIPVAGLIVGRAVEVDGTLAAPYGQLEIRDVGSLSVGTDDTEPDASLATLADIGEGTEGSLVAIGGTVDSVETDSGRLTITIGDSATAVRVLADPPTGLSRADVARGDVVIATGIVGQHATAAGRLDGYRVWLRRGTDLVVRAPIATDTADPLPPATETSVYYDLASALATRGADVDVQGAVTATTGLLDIGSPTVVVDDGTAAVAVVLPSGTDAPRVGMRVRVTGKVGRWEGGPTVVASRMVALGELQAIAPRPVAGALDGSLEWQLVRICGRIDQYTSAGSRWRLDMLVDGHPVAVLGEPAAAISVGKSSIGRLAVVIGIVRRSTSDSSAFQLLPRSPLDFLLGPAPDVAANVLGSARASGSVRGSGDVTGSAAGRVDIGSLSDYVGQTVTVAGLVTDTAPGTATIDDGTAQVRLGGPSAAEALAMLEPGDAIEVTGVVRLDPQGLIIETDPASIVAMPGDRHDAVSGGGGAADIVAGVARSTAVASPPAGGSMRRATATAPLPDGPTILALLLLVGAVMAVFALTRRGHWLRRLPVPRPSLPPARLARYGLRRPGRGPGEGP